MENRVNLSDAQEKLIEGAYLLYRAVVTTFGPQGSTVVITDRDGVPHVTKDGATVASAVSSPDPEVNCGIELVRQASLKTAKEAGDGTTTSVVLAHNLLKTCSESMKDIRNLHRDLDNLYRFTEGALERQALPVKDNMEMVEKIATLAANNDPDIGRVIRTAYEETGMGVNIILEQGFSKNDVITASKGIKFPKGLESAYLANNIGKGIFEAVDCLVVLYEQPVLSFNQLTDNLSLSPGEPVLIIAPKFSTSVVQTAISSRRSGYDICLVEADGWGDIQRENLRDISALLGAFKFSERGIYTGQADHVHVDINSTTIIASKNDPTWRVNDLKELAEACDMEDVRERIQNRISVLENGTCTITVGASSESELKEKMDRYEDAICAVRAAVKSGVLPGGGKALYLVSCILNEATEGIGYLSDALRAPYDLLLKSSGTRHNFSLHPYDGIDFMAGEYVEDCIEAGIIDPLEVELSALRNAISVVKLILSTRCIVKTFSPEGF